MTDEHDQNERDSALCDGVTDLAGLPTTEGPRQREHIEGAGPCKYVYRPPPSGSVARVLRECREYREELSRRGLSESDDIGM